MPPTKRKRSPQAAYSRKRQEGIGDPRKEIRRRKRGEIVIFIEAHGNSTGISKSFPQDLKRHVYWHSLLPINNVKLTYDNRFGVLYPVLLKQFYENPQISHQHVLDRLCEKYKEISYPAGGRNTLDDPINFRYLTNAATYAYEEGFLALVDAMDDTVDKIREYDRRPDITHINIENMHLFCNKWINESAKLKEKIKEFQKKHLSIENLHAIYYGNFDKERIDALRAAMYSIFDIFGEAYADMINYNIKLNDSFGFSILNKIEFAYSRVIELDLILNSLSTLKCNQFTRLTLDKVLNFSREDHMNPGIYILCRSPPITSPAREENIEEYIIGTRRRGYKDFRTAERISFEIPLLELQEKDITYLENPETPGEPHKKFMYLSDIVRLLMKAGYRQIVVYDSSCNSERLEENYTWTRNALLGQIPIAEDINYDDLSPVSEYSSPVTS